MNKNFLKTAIVMIVLAVTGLNVNAQVTIGSLNDPLKGVLLELKTKDAQNPNLVTDDANATVDETGGGLLFPRVKLVSKNTLDPFINSTNPVEWTKNAKLTHAGMVVYNINKDEQFEVGLYVWNGAEWTQLQDGNSTPNKERWFPMPAFNIELTLGNNTVDLYAEYAKQYDFANNTDWFVSNNNKSASELISPIGHVYGQGELDYVITYYDKTVMDNVAITNGILTFNAKTLDLDAHSYINVIAIVK
ncbi:MAG: hypothetical protein LBO74_02470 [Candidatus Symbiothrix sp.]|jgi:hypothetical protein|nr:hypothetical protein [Candidatus Symbiothrix sp.]